LKERILSYITNVPDTENHPDFPEVQRKLDETITSLKTTNDPNLRRELLKQMGKLVAEAERLAYSLKSTL
jgi:hypothetical protein